MAAMEIQRSPLHKVWDFAETMDHFVNYYGSAEETENKWRDIFIDSVTRQKRNRKICPKSNYDEARYFWEVGRTSDPAPILQLL